MRVFALALLLAGCKGSPYCVFEEGHDLHFILAVSGPTKVRPVCTVGSDVAKPPWRKLRGNSEVATIRVAPGKHTVSVWERYARSGARARLDVRRDLWLVMHVEPGKRDGSFDVYERPPRDRRWLPLIAVPW